MPAWFRAGLFAALFVFVTTPSPAAEKTFQDDALDDAAITLEADLKDEAGTVAKPLAKLKQEAEALVKSQDLAGAAESLCADRHASRRRTPTSWRRLADIWLLIPATEEDDGSTRIERARTAAYIAYQRATTPEDESASLVTLANAFTKREEWRQALNALKLALDLQRDAGAAERQYEALREKYGFRVSNFSVDSDAASPRACFQFTELLPKRTDFSPFVAVAGQDKPALSVDDQQICVEGLKHGESYSITLRAGLPSTVGEDLLKDAAFNIYVRDRSPSVRLSGKAYVLPRTGQQGIPLITVNTERLKVDHLPDRRPKFDRQRARAGSSSAISTATVSTRSPTEGREGLDRRAQGREGAQPGDHHRLPDHGGGARIAARRLSARGAARRCGRQRLSASAPRNGSSSPISG